MRKSSTDIKFSINMLSTIVKPSFSGLLEIKKTHLNHTGFGHLRDPGVFEREDSLVIIYSFI